jgi:rubrerythrin
MKCDNCGHEFESAVPHTSCPECDEQLDTKLNYKSPVQDKDDE